MPSVGAAAPSFELPAVLDGERTSIALKDFLNRSIVVLAFYPGDFNPGCDEVGAIIEGFEPLARKPGVEVLAVSGDSLHSHRAFADRYDLSLPLLADLRGEVAADYDVAVTNPGASHRTHRAVVVVNPTGEIEFAWVGTDPAAAPPFERLRSAVGAAGGPDAAAERYRLGHACIVEGRRALEAGRSAHDEKAWDRAGERLAAAEASLAAAGEHFEAATAFANRDSAIETLLAATDLAGRLETCADWLREVALASAAGEGEVAERVQRDAERLLEGGGVSVALPDPTVFPPAEPPEALLAAATPDVERSAPESDGDLAAAVPRADEIDSWVETATDSNGEASIDEAELADIKSAIEEQTERG